MPVTRRRSALRTAISAIAVTVCLIIGLSACDGSSDHSTSSAPPTSASAPTTSAAALQGVAVGTNPQTRLKVDEWGYTADGLLSVIVSNVGDATVRSARAIISGQDAYGNLVAAGTAQAGTQLGVRCCTIIALAPGQQYGLYLNIGTRISRVKDGVRSNTPRSAPTRRT